MLVKRNATLNQEFFIFPPDGGGSTLNTVQHSQPPSKLIYLFQGARKTFMDQSCVSFDQYCIDSQVKDLQLLQMSTVVLLQFCTIKFRSVDMLICRIDFCEIGTELVNVDKEHINCLICPGRFNATFHFLLTLINVRSGR